MLGMGTKYMGRRAWGVGRVRPHPTPYVQRLSLLRSSRVPDDVVHGKLYEVGAFVEPTLRLRANLDQAPLDVLDLEQAQLILIIEMRGDHLLDLAPDALALGLVRAPIRALQRAGRGLEAEHLRGEPGPPAVAPHQT